MPNDEKLLKKADYLNCRSLLFVSYILKFLYAIFIIYHSI